MFKKSLIGSVIFHLLLVAGSELVPDHSRQHRAAPGNILLILADLEFDLQPETSALKDEALGKNCHPKNITGPEGLAKERRERVVAFGAAEKTPSAVSTDLEKLKTEVSVLEPENYEAGAEDFAGFAAGGLTETDTKGPDGEIQGPDRSSQPDRLPVKIYGPGPAYPFRARQNDWEGVTVLKILIKPDGLIGEVTILQSSGYSLLDQAAMKAVNQWRYRPALKNGIAVAWQVRVRIKFTLEG